MMADVNLGAGLVTPRGDLTASGTLRASARTEKVARLCVYEAAINAAWTGTKRKKAAPSLRASPLRGGLKGCRAGGLKGLCLGFQFIVGPFRYVAPLFPIRLFFAEISSFLA